MGNMTARIYTRALASVQVASDCLSLGADGVRDAIAALVQAEAALGQVREANEQRLAIVKVRRPLEFAEGTGVGLVSTIERVRGPLRAVVSALDEDARRAAAEDQRSTAMSKLQALMSSGVITRASALP